MSELVHYVIEDQVAVVTLDHPPLNALDVPTKEALSQVFTELEQRRDELRAAVLTGAGPKAFAAGADIKTFLELDPPSAKRRLMRSHQIFAQVEGFAWPVIAAIHGFCLGAGLELALACDIRYADQTARLGFPEVNLSVFPGNGGCCRGLSHLSLGRLKELAYSGAIISAEQGLAYGLLEKVVPPGQAVQAALELAHAIAGKGPLGVAAAKRVINRVRGLSLAEGLEVESDEWAGLTASQDMKEGARAFMDKRPPVYKGQ